MTQVLATYTCGTDRRRIELVSLPRGKVVLDRRGDAVLVVAELSPDEGEEHARAVLDAGGYLRRARAGEPRLCRRLDSDEPIAARLKPGFAER